jgi:signal transduction histidine kinase
LYNREVEPRVSQGPRDLWLPALIGLAGILLSLAGWGVLVEDRHEQLRTATTRSAHEVGASIEQLLAQQVVAGIELAELWGTLRSHSGSDAEADRAWNAQAALRLDRTTGLAALSRVPRPDGPVGPRLVGPAHDADGALGYRVVVPIGGDDGAVAARFWADPVLDALLRGRAEGHAVEVLWNGESIFSQGEPSQDPWQRWWRAEENVPLPLGGEWRVVLRPTPELAAARLTPVPHYLLAAGVLLSLVLGLVVYQLRLILRQARFLATSNRALERRGSELESTVAERTEALEAAIEELETFNTSVSHDLRSPLGAILNFTAILEEDYPDRPLDEAGRELLARIRRSATRATGLLEDLLQMSRAGRAALSLEPVDMTALARESFALARAAEGEDADDVEFILEPLPEAVGDRTLLGEVFANLFGNALKYSRGRDKRRIAVAGGRDDDDCIYHVTDDGQGFDMRFADKLFRPFERLHNDDAIDGTGVGLAIVARIVKRHGGRTWAEGRPGEGARFSFTIPQRGAP